LILGTSNPPGGGGGGELPRLPIAGVPILRGVLFPGVGAEEGGAGMEISCGEDGRKWGGRLGMRMRLATLW